MPIDLNEHLKQKRDNKGPGEPPRRPNRPSSGGGKGGGGFDLRQFNLGGKAVYIIIGVVILLLLLLLRPFTIVNSGEVGIKITAGKYDRTPLRPGIHFFVPVIQDILIVDTRVRTINFSSTEDFGVLGKNQGIFKNDAISVMDARGLPVMTELTVQYRLNPANAPETIATYGLSWEQKIINPVVRDVVRNVIGRYPAEELPMKRNEIANLISQHIRDSIDKLKDAPVELISVQLREIVLPQNIKVQIEKVQIARQEAQRVGYEVERAKKEAQKVAELAKGQANAKRIAAQGIADSILIEAKAKASANRDIAKTLTPSLLQLRSIDAKAKFNDALKANKDAQIILLPGGATPNLFLDGPRKRAAAISK